jgi:hypothetical protein
MKKNKLSICKWVIGVLAIFALTSCGQHSFEDWLFGESSSSVALSSSSGASSSSSGATATAEFEPAMLGLQPGATVAEINFNWYSTTAEGSQSIVRIFKNNEAIATKTGSSNNASSGNRWHKVTVDGLEANTQYTYRVSNNNSDWSNEYSYKTPPSGNFKFAFVADPQLTTGSQASSSQYFSEPPTTAAGWAETLSKIAAAGASLIVSNGDQVNTSNDESEYNVFFAPEQLKNIPIAPVMGNHDRNCAFFYHFNLPNQASDAPTSTCSSRDRDNMSNYYFLYNRVLFVGLNTSPTPTSIDTAAIYVAKYRNAIRAAKTAYAGQYDWAIAFHHKSTDSPAGHANDPDIQLYEDAGFRTMMSEEGINLVVAGHDHVYAKSHPIDGILYLTLNTAGGLKYYSFTECPQSLEKCFRSRKPEYTIVDVTSSTLKVSTYTIDNTTAPHDQFTISK